MSKTTYILSLVAATALGAGITQVADYDARAAIEEQKEIEVESIITPAQFANATGSQMAQYGCDQIDTLLGLSGATACTLDDIVSVSGFFNDSSHPGMAVLEVRARVSGTWVAGDPE